MNFTFPIDLDEPPSNIFPIILLTIKLTLNFVGLLLNCVLLWLILANLRNMYKTLSILLLYTLFNDMMISITTLLTVNRSIMCHETYVNVYYGPCTLVSPYLCHTFAGIHIHALQNWILSQILLIVFRTSVLRSSFSKKFLSIQRTVTYCLIAYLPGMVTLIWFLVQFDDPNKLMVAMKQCSKEDFSYSMISGFESYHHSPMQYAMILLLLPNIPHYFLAFCFRHKQNHDLKRRSLSTSTLKMHATLRKISTFKAFLPLILCFDVMIYTLCQVDLLPPQISEYFLGTMSSTINILNPLVAIICFRPYRATVKATWRSWSSKFATHHKLIFTEEEIVSL